MSNYLDRIWAENGDKTDIPVDAQGNGSVSQEQGWTELYDRDVITDPTALSLSRSNMNRVFNTITSNTKQWLDQCYPDYYQLDNNGNPVEYKIYSAVRYNDGVYLSKVNNNTALPTDDTKWSLFQTLDFASEAEAIARTDTNKWMNPFVSGKLIDNELIGNIPKSAINLGTTDLNTLSSLSNAGIYYQSLDSNTSGNNYPINYSGTLIVTRSSEVTHTYIVHSGVGAGENANKVYVRGFYTGSWSSWKDISGGTDTLNPVGSGIISYDGEVFTGYIPAEGQAVSRSVYPLLFAKWGTKYGAGDGSTTFNVIDMRGLFARGKGFNSNDYNIVQQDAIRNITGGNINALQLGGTGRATGAFYSTLGSASNATSQAHIVRGFDASLVVPTATENRPLNMSVRYLIKAS
jgi:microcystin-dependent protein